MNEHNRRQHPRSEIDHPATLSYQGTTLSDCRIRNYSKGGLYLESSTGDFHALVTTGKFKPGGPNLKHAQIQFPQRRKGGDPIAVTVRLSFISKTGVGVAYLDNNPDLFNYFQSLKETNSINTETSAALTKRGNQSSKKIELVFVQIIKACIRFLNKRMPEFFAECENRLPDEADRASVNTLRTDIFYAQSVLRDQKHAIIRSQLTQLNTKFTRLRQHSGLQESDPAQDSISQDMDLVNKEDFEEWVVIVGLGRSIEAEIHNSLHILEMGLTCLVKRAINSDTNPVSPAYLLWTLSSSLENLNIELPVRRIIYDIFKETVLSHTEELYAELGNILERHGVDSKVVSIKPKAPIESRQPATDIKPTRTSKKRSMVQALSSMISSVWRNRENDRKSVHDKRSASDSQIIASLNSLNGRSDRPIADLIDQSLAKKGGRYGTVKLNRETRNTISATEQLLSNLKQDNRLSRGLQDLVSGLEVPIIKEVIENPAMMDDANHPTRKLLESIDELAPYSSTDDTEESLLQIIEQLSNSSAGQSQDQLVEATHKIEALLSRKKEVFNQNLSVVLESTRPNTLLEKARQIIERQLSQRLGNQSVAIILARLLQLGWVGLLIQSKASKTDPGRKTKAYLDALDSLLKLFAQNSEPTPFSPENLNSLTTLLRDGFSEYPIHLTKAEQLIKEIEYNLTEGGVESRLTSIKSRIVIEPAYIQKLIDEQAPPIRDADGQAVPETKWGNRIQSIKKDDWITQQREHGQVRLINLAWRNSAGTRFVFVDGSGNKALDTDGISLASQFEMGKLSLLESRELPMVERAVERMLKDTFSRISTESQIDELTGLLNRKALSKKVDELLNLSISEGSHHALILLDIDQFAMINDLCGYEGGDQLLKSVTSIITTYQRDDAVIARTGDDEFAILLKGATIEHGYQIAETQRQALATFKFNWEQQSMPISVSIGIVAVDNTGTDAQSLLKAASSACDLAKQSGRNCCRVFQLSDEELKQQNRLIKSVPVIEEAMEKNRISLHGQLITPLFLNEGNDHYEVLLRLLDENNRIKDPGEFIRAAEKYDRMRSVDRWIIDAFFSWVKQYGEQATQIEGFSLNLSGQSLMNKSIRAHIIKHLNDGALPPAKIGFEITETAAVKNIAQVNEFIEEIRQFGCKFYLDDFGSGYASYSYLKDLSVDYVKIDGVFVKDMLKEQSSHAMVRSITEIAHYMKKKVIAEYVESEALIIELREIGVDFGQGYGIGMPQPLNTIRKATAAYG